MVNRSVPLGGLKDVADRLAKIVSGFDAVALSENKRAFDAIPGLISGWRQSFEYGLSTNARIRSLSAAQNEGFSRFSAG